MKVYLYNTDTGAYLGEDFDSERTVLDGEGETKVAPPPYGNGKVALFDRSSHQWQVVGADQFHTMSKERF
jgi:hypothetical protein